MGEDCDRLLQELADLLHGEVTPERKQALHTHLEACPPCFERADFQAHLHQLVARRCTEAVPDSLRAKILAALEADAGGEPVDSAPPATSP